jgi:ABC-type molybdate transport system ATPase subunit
MAMGTAVRFQRVWKLGVDGLDRADSNVQDRLRVCVHAEDVQLAGRQPRPSNMLRRSLSLQ